MTNERIKAYQEELEVISSVNTRIFSAAMGDIWIRFETNAKSFPEDIKENLMGILAKMSKGKEHCR